MDDVRIVQLYWNRDETAIPETANKYGGYCTAIALNIVGNPEDAEECVNDTWLSAWNSMPPQRPSALGAFLGRITRNISFNRYKRAKAEKRGGGSVDAVLDELGECVSGKDDPAQTADLHELADIINSFLDTLPDEKKRLFISRYWYTDSISEIAARYGMKRGAVSTALSRMRSDLRLFLSERGYTV